MFDFKEPVCDVIRFGSDVIVTSGDDCNCDLGDGPEGDDVICTGGTGVGGDIECIMTPEQGNC